MKNKKLNGITNFFEGNELHENIVQLKTKAKNGKTRKTDVLDTEGIFRLIEYVPSFKAESFK